MGGRRILTDEQLGTMSEMREAGVTFAQIARHFATRGTPISRAAIRWQCFRLGVEAPVLPGGAERMTPQRRIAKLLAASTAWAQSPAGRERKAATGRALFEVRMPAAARARSHAPAARAKAERTKRERRFGWLPLEYRPDYRRLTRSLRISAAEARAIVEEQIRRDAERHVATGKLQRAVLGVQGNRPRLARGVMKDAEL